MRAEAAVAIEAARATLEQERSERLAEVNAAIAERRAPRPPRSRPRKAAAQATGRDGRCVTSPPPPGGWPPAGNPTTTPSREAVSAVMSAGVTR